MLKKGFTLSELLVALGIVSVIVAVTTPLISNIAPDKDKVMVIKNYKILSEITNELLNNPEIYYIDNDNCTQHDLTCTGQPVVEPYNAAEDADRFSGPNKYANLVYDKLMLRDNTHTKDGVQWNISNEGDDIVVEIQRTENSEPRSFTVRPSGQVVGRDDTTIAYLRNPIKLNER